MGVDLEIPTARVFRPLLEAARYKACWGGRSSGKSHFMAESVVEWCLMHPGARVLCAREVQLSLEHSSKKLIEDKIARFKAPGFEVLKNMIRTPGDGVIIFQGMNNHNSDTIKSYEGFDVAWVEEAHRLSPTSLSLLRPTIRKPNSEIWFSWNPTRKSDAVDAFFRGVHCPDNAIVVKANWSDNPFFPAEMEAERQHDLAHSPSYRHVWEGDYATVVEGAYFARELHDAREAGRLTQLALDPLLEVRAFWDLGIEDSMAIWIAQFNSRRIDVLDYMEGQGQPLAYYTRWLRANGYGGCLCVLPHDGARRGLSDATTFAQHLKDAEFRVKVVPNQGAGAATARIEALRRLFPRIWFDAAKCAAGLEALGSYHERRDDKRQIGLGPMHDWASHGSDSAGLMAITYEEPKASLKPPERQFFSADPSDAGTAWLAS